MVGAEREGRGGEVDNGGRWETGGFGTSSGRIDSLKSLTLKWPISSSSTGIGLFKISFKSSWIGTPVGEGKTRRSNSSTVIEGGAGGISW